MTQTRLNDLAEALKEVSRCYDSLHLLLEKEQEQFLSFDAEGLIRTTSEKGSLLEQLKRAERELLEQKVEVAELLDLRVEEGDPIELVDISIADNSGTVKQLGAALIQKAREVSAMLQRNRVMLEEGVVFVNDALACFQGAITGESMAYASLGDSRKRKPRAVCLRREV